MVYSLLQITLLKLCHPGIFLKFDHPIYENDTSPFGKGGIDGDFSGG
jgi:hypothetical protein